MAEQWLSIVEYARAFNVSDMTVRRRIKTGKLHAIMKDGKYFIPVPGGKMRGRTEPQREPIAAPAMKPDHAEMVVIKGHPAAQKTYVPPVAVEPRMTSSEAAFRGVTGMASAAPQFDRQYDRQQDRHYDRPAPVDPHRHKHETLEGSPNQPRVSPNIPTSLTRPLEERDTSLADTRALLAFCEASLKKLTELERRQVEKFKAKLETLEAKLAERDQRICHLQQQVEDLQVLVRIMESKSS